MPWVNSGERICIFLNGNGLGAGSSFLPPFWPMTAARLLSLLLPQWAVTSQPANASARALPVSSCMGRHGCSHLPLADAVAPLVSSVVLRMTLAKIPRRPTPPQSRGRCPAPAPKQIRMRTLHEAL